MALTDLERIRLVIQDKPQTQNAVYTANGVDTRYELAYPNPQEGSAFVETNQRWAMTAASFQADGYVVFPDRVSANSAFRVEYAHTVFTDDELRYYMEAGGDTRGAQILAIETLMFDSLKRAQWGAPDGTSYNDTAAQAQLIKMHERLLKQQSDAAIGFGGVKGWER